MKSKAQKMVALALVLAAYWNGAMTVSGADSEDQVAVEARAKDPAWKPSGKEAGLIQVGDSETPGALKNFCLNAEGNILACFASQQAAKSSNAKSAQGIRVYSPKGELLNTLPLEIKPGAICVAKDGSIFVAGDGQILKLDATGKVLASAASPVAKEPVTITKEMEEMLKESAKRSKRSLKEEAAIMKTNLEHRRAEVTGLAATAEDVFMAVGAPSDFTYRIYRFDYKLQNPKMVVEKLRGCCGQMDIQAHADKLWIPHNARHTIESRDRDGKELSKFGKSGKVKATDFGGCCEPKNLRILPNGDILAAESGPPTCIKRFSASGKFIEVVAVLAGKGDCVRVTVEMSPDESQYYLLDTQHDAIRIFKAKS